MDFNKPAGCKKIEKFIMDNLKSEAEKECLTNVITGKAVLKADAIDLLLTLIQAMTIANEVNMEEFEAAKVILDGEETKVEKNPPSPGSSGTQKVVPNNGSQSDKKVETPKVKFNKENVCYFYATNRCKFGKDCRKEHPKICNKFKKYGLKKFNKNNGCTEECEFYHPMACFESMKSKTCKRSECKFYHINGTKKEETLTGNMNGQATTHNNGTQNVNNTTNNKEETSKNEQVFQLPKQSWEIALERMTIQMEKIMDWQLTMQTQLTNATRPQQSTIQPLFQPQQLRQT